MADDKNDEAKAPAKVATPKAKKRAGSALSVSRAKK